MARQAAAASRARTLAPEAPHAPAGIHVAPAPARIELQHQHGDNEDAGERRDLRGRRQAVHAEPDVEDAEGQRLQREIVHGAEIRHRLHQHEREAGGDRGPGQRQAHGAEEAPVVHPRDLEERVRRQFEGRPRHHVDVGVEHRAHHHDGTAHGADLGEPVIPPRLPAEGIAQRALHRPRIVQEVGVDVGDEIGRHGEGQHQHPFEHPAARKLVARHHPGRAHAQHQAEPADACHERDRVGDIAGQHRPEEVAPEPAAVLRRGGDHREDRRRQDQREHERGNEPAIRPGEVGPARQRGCWAYHPVRSITR